MDSVSPSTAAPSNLIVEDDAELRETIVRILLQAGHAAVPASSGEDALDLMAAAEPAVDAGDRGRLPLFAARVPTVDVITPALARFEKVKAVYWQTGQLAYALTGSGRARVRERATARLARKLQ